MLLFLQVGEILKRRHHLFRHLAIRHYRPNIGLRTSRRVFLCKANTLKLDCASSSLSFSSTNDSEAHFELSEYGIVGMIDCEQSDASAFHHQPPSMYMKFLIKSVLDSFIEEALNSVEEPYFSGSRLKYLLSRALERFPIANIVSCCILKLEGEKLFCACVGTCGFLIIRDEKVVYDSRPSCIEILEKAYEKFPQSHLEYHELSIQEDDVVIVGNRG